MIDYIDDLIRRYPVLEKSRQDIFATYKVLEKSFLLGGKLLVAGNGGSAADADHIVGELMKGFVKSRRLPEDFSAKLNNVDKHIGEEISQKLQGALPAIALTVHNGLSTAFLNDVDGQVCFAQQVYGYGQPGDVFLGISTSGNSKNVIAAAVTAKAKDMTVIGLTGKDGGRLRELCDAAIVVHEDETYKIQELHLPIYHTLCLMLENRFFE